MTTLNITPTIPTTYKGQMNLLAEARESLGRAKAFHAGLVDSEAGSSRIFEAKMEITKISNLIKTLETEAYIRLLQKASIKD